MDDELKAIILVLIRNIYIDNEPYFILVKPNLVRVVEMRLKNQNYMDEKDYY